MGTTWTTTTTSTASIFNGTGTFSGTSGAGWYSYPDESEIKVKKLSDEDLVMHKLSDKCTWVTCLQKPKRSKSYRVVKKCSTCGAIDDSKLRTHPTQSAYTTTNSGWGSYSSGNTWTTYGGTIGGNSITTGAAGAAGGGGGGGSGVMLVTGRTIP